LVALFSFRGKHSDYHWNLKDEKKTFLSCFSHDSFYEKCCEIKFFIEKWRKFGWFSIKKVNFLEILLSLKIFKIILRFFRSPYWVFCCCKYWQLSPKPFKFFPNPSNASQVFQNFPKSFHIFSKSFYVLPKSQVFCILPNSD